VVLAMLAVLVFGVYVNSFGNEFLSDDISAIANNPQIGNVWVNTGGSVYGLPEALFNSLIYHFGGLSPVGYHIDSAIWHLGVTVLVYLIVLSLFGRRDLAIVAAVLFAVHPIHTEAVTWISGLPYLLYGFFTLLSLLVFILVDKGWVNRWFSILVIGAAIFAFWSSEKSAILPAVLLLYLFLFSNLKRGWQMLIPIIVAWGILMMDKLGIFAERAIGVGGGLTGGGPRVFNPLIQWPVAIATYIKLLIWPLGLTLYHEDFGMTTLVFLVHVGVMTAFLGLLAWAWVRGKKWLIFGGLMFLVSLAPTMLPIQVSWIVAERYVYLGSLGFSLLTAYVLIEVGKKREGVFWAILILIVSCYSMLTIRRNFEWKNQDMLWPATVAVSPTSSLAHNNMGDYWVRHGDLKLAAKEFATAMSLRPNYADATHNLGSTYLRMGEATRAAELFERAIQINPKLVESYVSLVGIDLTNKDYEKAKANIEKAQEMNPGSYMVYNAWTAYYWAIGDKNTAIQMAQKALELNPYSEVVKQNLEFVSK
jgi:hypothetical protein